MNLCDKIGHELYLTKLFGSRQANFACRHCPAHWYSGNVAGVRFRCPACLDVNIVTEKVIIKNHSKNLLCPKCSEKLRLIRAALEQMKCDGFFEQGVRRRDRGRYVE